MNLVFSVFLAQAAPAPYVGLDLGVTDSTGPTTPKELAFTGGGRAGWIFYDHVALGLFTHYYVSKQYYANTAYLPLLAEILYYPHHTPYDMNTYYAGAQFGTTHLVIKDGTGKHTDDATTVGLTIGYSILVSENLTVGPEFIYLWVFSDLDNFKMSLPQLSLKYLF